jgi:mono/diheme cytochrome c family protein
MSCIRFAIFSAVALAAAAADHARAAERDLAAEVRAIFTARCARCHGPDLARPKGGFGYVLDLRRLAADRDKIVPHKPDESDIWLQVERDEMPPPNSPTGPLSTAQKEIIRAWIAAGAPPGESPPPVDTTPADTSDAPQVSPSWRALLWLGRFHLLLLHFPIALLMAAAVAEAWSVWKGERALSPAARFCLVLGAIAVVPTVVLGWLHALDGHGAGPLLALHRWLGTAAGAWVVVTAVLAERAVYRGASSWVVRLMILAGALLVGLAAHFGGLMVHGKHFYDW